MNLIVYTAPGCPKCEILKKKLASAGLSFSTSDDIQRVADKGFMSAPVLEIVQKGVFLNFGDAARWILDQ